MTAELLDGERVAGRIKMELADRAARLAAAGRRVGLGTVLVGDDGPSAKYVAMKLADCEEIGIPRRPIFQPSPTPSRRRSPWRRSSR